MTRTEAAFVLATFASAFGREVDESAMELWYGSTLERCDPSVAARTIERIVAEDEWFPTPARFNAVRRAVERGMEPPHRALPAPLIDQSERERVHALITKTRATLRGEA